ncbi:MAG: tryptophan synthase subunit alpha [Candidatus Dormibacteraeota bacterium]|nr:tryptophan synthase subunit alpha [Candidatus Dormibacteraeota bacterium]
MLRIENGRLGLIPYLMAGHPDRDRSVAAARALAALPIAALELGIPFSDPLADGPVIQRAGQAALEAGATVAGCLEIAAAVAGQAPVVFMSYVNPILSYGPERFAADAAAAGVAGVILPDLPPEESESVAAALHEHGLATVFMVAPTSTEERIRIICDASSGFVYCVTLTGITGVRSELPEGVGELLARVKAQTALPVAAGFGIATPEHLEALRGLADAAAVGSAVVKEIDAGRDPGRLVEELLAACR